MSVLATGKSRIRSALTGVPGPWMVAPPSVEELIRKYLEQALRPREERRLVSEHRRCFGRRVQALDRAFFPGQEKSPEGIDSMANGAFTSFGTERIYDGGLAFEQVLEKALPAKGYLYFWRSSATIIFLRHEASSALSARLNLLRNVRIHLREGFDAVGVTCGESLWAPRGVNLARRGARPDVARIDVDLDGARGKAAVQRVIEAAGVPLTRNEIAAVMERRLGLSLPEPSPGVDVEAAASNDHERMEAHVSDQLLGPKVDRFVESMDDQTRRLLVARGYGDGAPTRSFRNVAATLGGAEETLRRREQRIFERFRAVFADRDEARVAARLLTAALSRLELAS